MEVWFHSFLTSELKVVIVNWTPLPLFPREQLLGNTERDAEWAPEPVWTPWSVEKYFEMCCESNYGSSVVRAESYSVPSKPALI